MDYRDLLMSRRPLTIAEARAQFDDQVYRDLYTVLVVDSDLYRVGEEPRNPWKSGLMEDVLTWRGQYMEANPRHLAVFDERVGVSRGVIREYGHPYPTLERAAVQVNQTLRRTRFAPDGWDVTVRSRTDASPYRQLRQWLQGIHSQPLMCIIDEGLFDIVWRDGEIQYAEVSEIFQSRSNLSLDPHRREMFRRLLTRGWSEIERLSKFPGLCDALAVDAQQWLTGYSVRSKLLSQ